MTSYLGYVPLPTAPNAPPPPTEIEIQELYRELNFDPQRHANDSAPSGVLRLSFNIQVSGCILLFCANQVPPAWLRQTNQYCTCIVWRQPTPFMVMQVKAASADQASIISPLAIIALQCRDRDTLRPGMGQEDSMHRSYDCLRHSDKLPGSVRLPVRESQKFAAMYKMSFRNHW